MAHGDRGMVTRQRITGPGIGDSWSGHRVQLGRSQGHIGASPYLSTNHHTRTLAISSANSTKTVTRTAMNSSFVSLCAATSFW